MGSEPARVAGGQRGIADQPDVIGSKGRNRADDLAADDQTREET